MTTPRLEPLLAAMTGRRLPGGCSDCSAYQVLSRRTEGLYVMAVHHDDACPHIEEATQ